MRAAIDRASSPIIVCGVGRSGTSLLQSMLHAHPEIAFPPETQFFRRYVSTPGRRRRYEKQGAEGFVVTLESDIAFARAGISTRELLGPWLAGQGRLSMGEVYLRFLRLATGRDRNGRCGDKDPRLLEHLDALSTVAPEARVIHVVRDPRDVVLSRMNVAWAADRPWWSHAFLCDAQLRNGRTAGRRAFGNGYLEIRYEDLIEEPEATLRLVCGHVQVTYDPSMLEFSTAARSLVHESELPWKAETMGRLLRANRDKWREGLGAKQIRLIEGICAQAMADFDYAPASLPTPSPWQRSVLTAAALIARCSARSYAFAARIRG